MTFNKAIDDKTTLLRSYDIAPAGNAAGFYPLNFVPITLENESARHEYDSILVRHVSQGGVVVEAKHEEANEKNDRGKYGQGQAL